MRPVRKHQLLNVIQSGRGFSLSNRCEKIAGICGVKKTRWNFWRQKNSPESKNTGIPTTKIKPYVDLVRGKKVEDALRELSALPSPAAERVAKVIKSAASNAENELMSRISDLKIVEAYANEGPTLKRFRARARGRAFRILKRSSHVTVVVDDSEAREDM